MLKKRERSTALMLKQAAASTSGLATSTAGKGVVIRNKVKARYSVSMANPILSNHVKLGALLDFSLPPELEASEPPEARGLARDEVRPP